VYLSNGDGTFTHKGSVTPYPQWRNATSGDFNGDGKADFLINTTTSGAGWYVYLSNGDGTFTHKGSVTPYPQWHSATPGDFNGDGKTDFLINTTTSGAGWFVYLSNGDGTFTHKGSVTPYPQWRNATSGDFNGDGKTDFLINTTTSGAGWYVYLSNGDGTFTHKGSVTPYPQWHSATPGDFNGDGKADFLINTATSGAGWFVYLANTIGSPAPDLLDFVTTGLSVRTTVTHTPLTDPAVYTKGTGAVYPYVDIQAPMYVVSSVSTSDGIGGNHVTSYTYSGARSHLLGGGFLGFSTMRMSDPQSRIYSTATYRQDYPYQGQPVSAERRTYSNVLLGLSTTLYIDTLLNTGISPTWHRSLPTEVNETNYEFSTGNLVTSSKTTSTYDSYGNPLVIKVDSGGGYVKTTTNQYDNIIDTERWFLGRLRRATVTSVTP
jgi:hypothetical protein